MANDFMNYLRMSQMFGQPPIPDQQQIPPAPQLFPPVRQPQPIFDPDRYKYRTPPFIPEEMATPAMPPGQIQQSGPPIPMQQFQYPEFRPITRASDRAYELLGDMPKPEPPCTLR
jgi:hypothetical protein